MYTSSDAVHPLIQKSLAQKIPIADLIGFRLEEDRRRPRGEARCARSKHVNPMGTLHGGVLCDLGRMQHDGHGLRF